MVKKEYSAIKNIITEYGLKPSTQRNFSLLTTSIIALSYTVYLRKRLGYSYEALAFMGKKDWFHSWLGETIIISKTLEYLKKNNQNLDQLILSLMADFNKIKEKILSARTIKDQSKSIVIILENYLEYMSVLSVCNCFWRYLGNQEHDQFISDRQIKNIARVRNLVARFYPRIERIILSVVQDIGKLIGLNGTLLQYLSCFEFKRYLKRGIPRKKILELKKRQAGYFYVFEEKNKREIITTNQAIIDRIKKDLYDVDAKIASIKGFPAYSGLIKGNVFNVAERKKPAWKKYILVAPSTHPQDIKLIKNSIAIITDEGGILSHAAIMSREFKIPCIIGTKIATKVLKNGYLVEVDAQKGKIKIIDRP